MSLFVYTISQDWDAVYMVQRFCHGLICPGRPTQISDHKIHLPMLRQIELITICDFDGQTEPKFMC